MPIELSASLKLSRVAQPLFCRENKETVYGDVSGNELCVFVHVHTQSDMYKDSMWTCVR